jgi:hypothetical protein
MRNTFKDPAVWKSVEAIKYVFNIANSENERFPSQRRLSRVHFHSLVRGLYIFNFDSLRSTDNAKTQKFHIVAQKFGSGWDEGKAAVAAGSVVATKQACGYESNIDYSQVDFPWEMEYKSWALPEPYNPREPVLHVRDASAVWVKCYILPFATELEPQFILPRGVNISSVWSTSSPRWQFAQTQERLLDLAMPFQHPASCITVSSENRASGLIY